ncbi:acetyl-CoA synthetase-like protein [Hymenopellis radicata]|nr:acetyl-CoA synthetase-like protein [Hymenopellis radicata]
MMGYYIGLHVDVFRLTPSCAMYNCDFPELPQTQALFSSTFLPPPLDGSLTLGEIYDWHLENNPEHRLFVCAREGVLSRVVHWGETGLAVRRGAQMVRKIVASRLNAVKQPVVAILAVSDTVTYWTLLMSVMKANCAVFPLSTRSSPTTIANLLTNVGVQYILVGPEPAMQNLAKDAVNIVEGDASTSTLPELFPIPQFDELYAPYSEMEHLPPVLAEQKGKLDRVMMYTHSSGSTSSPKPIPWTNRRFLQYAMVPWYSNQDFTDKVFAINAIPMFHVMGAIQISFNASCGNVMACFEPRTAPLVPTPDALIQCARATSSDYIYCVPSFAEAWSRNPDHVQWLSQRSGIIYGGGSLNKAAGDHLASSGVHIAQLYGSTESGAVNIMCPGGKDLVPEDWEYFRLPKFVETHMRPQGDNTFELVIISTRWNTLAVTNTKVDGKDAFATSDLLEPHPERPGYWRVYGRMDGQIIHSTGEKTNAILLESILNEDPYVSGTVVFGTGRFHAGVLVEPNPEFMFDSSDVGELSAFVEKIWPTVQTMNKIAPQHSRIFKEMIIVSKLSKPFTYTVKQTVRRQAITDEYAEEIKALYSTVEDATQIAVPSPPHWDIDSTTFFVRSIVASIVRQDLKDVDDLFENGCDSLQATWIRNSILRALRTSTPLDTRNVPPSFVYENPSIARLSAFMFSLISGSYRDSYKSPETLLKRYARNGRQVHTRLSLIIIVESPLDADTGAEQEFVLITGTTGSLGSYLLAELMQDPKVARVYALNRSSGSHSSSFNRQRQAFVTRGLDESILYSPKLILLGGDVMQPELGLQSNAYNHLLNSVTHIVHAAWRVNMNLSLSSFETNIKGVRCLVDFALRAHSTPKFLFVSSVAVLRNPQAQTPVRERLVDAEQACGSGYAESKWVAERILEQAASSTGMETAIVRLGQLSGGINGCWNQNEWFPAILRSAKDLQCLPTFTGVRYIMTRSQGRVAYIFTEDLVDPGGPCCVDSE